MSTFTVDPASPTLSVEPEHRLVYVDGRPLELTYLEYELLTHLVAHPLRVHTRNQLLQLVWGWTSISSRTVDTHVARLRGKLGDLRDSIETVHRVGYRYRPLNVPIRVPASRTGTAA